MMITPQKIIQYKQTQTKIVMMTAYDVITAQILDQEGIDIILVGDSVGSVFSGFKTTLPVTVDQILYHTQAVANGVENALIVSDMPFLSYQVSVPEAIRNAGRFLKEGNAHSVKIEVHSTRHIEIVKEVIDAGIPVMGHLGFTPQMLYQIGGYKVQGKSHAEIAKLISFAAQLESVGAFAIVLELIPLTVAKKVTQSISIPTIGIGAGKHCDGQVVVTEDILGLTQKKLKFIKHYANIRKPIKRAVKQFIKEVKAADFPGIEHSFGAS